MDRQTQGQIAKFISIAVGGVIALYVLMWLLPYVELFLALCGAWVLVPGIRAEQSAQPALTTEAHQNFNFTKPKKINDNGKQQQRQQRPALDPHPGRRFIKGERPFLAWM